MAKYQVPQFIETESKLVGPFTFRQFIYILAGAIVLFVVQNFVSLGTLVVIAVPVAAVSFGLAFLKIDGIPLPQYLMMAVGFAVGGKKYIYTKNEESEYLKQILQQTKK